MKNAMVILTVAVLGAVTTPIAHAHFRLLEPAPGLVQNEKGDPQKLAPCGGTKADAGTPSNAVTAVTGGQKLKIVAEETVFHPGHYRIALARKPTLLPTDPVATMHETERGPQSLSAVIITDPKPPFLVDGLWPHTAKTTAKWETEITIPNINCTNCQLQVIQFMAEHGMGEGGFSYHHCAALNITADPAKPNEDTRW